MSEALQGGSVFNAISGEELKKAVVAQILPVILAELDADCNFASHLTYPILSWEWQLTVTAYPHEPGSFRARAAGPLGGMKAKTMKASRLVDSSSDETTPDAVRVEAGLPVHRPEKTSAGIVADVPQPIQEKRG